jgi:hypothetical protein
MGKLTSVKPHLSVYEISERLKLTSGRERRRWLVIWNDMVDPREARQMALHKGLSVSTVHNLFSAYNRWDPKQLDWLYRVNAGVAIWVKQRRRNSFRDLLMMLLKVRSVWLVE